MIKKLIEAFRLAFGFESRQVDDAKRQMKAMRKRIETVVKEHDAVNAELLAQMAEVKKLEQALADRTANMTAALQRAKGTNEKLKEALEAA